MRPNERLSSSGDHIKGIDFRQVFGIFDPEQGLHVNGMGGGGEGGTIQQQQDINLITADTGMPECFPLLLIQTSWAVTFRNFEISSSFLMNLKMSYKHVAPGICSPCSRDRGGGRSEDVQNGPTRVGLPEHDMSGMPAMFFLPPTPF